VSAATGASNEAKIAVAPLQGNNATICTKAVAELAKEIAAVEPWKSLSRDRPPTTWDALSKWLAARGNEIGADVLILGTIRGQKLILEAYDPQRAKLIGLKRLVAPKGCRFSKTSKAIVTDWLKRVLELKGVPEAPPEISESTSPSAEKNDRPDEPPPLLGGERIGRPTKEVALESDRERPPPPKLEEPALVSATGELAIVSRSFSYTTPRTANLRAYDIAGMATPGIAIEARPLAREDTPLAPIFVRAFFRHSIGVKSARTDGGPPHPTSFLDAGASAGYRWTGALPQLAISPRLGYRRTQFSVWPSRDGVREDELPNVAYSSLEIGAIADYAIRDWMNASFSAAYLKVISGGEVFRQPFFQGSSSFAFDLEASLRFRIAPELSAIVGGAYQRFQLQFDAVPNALRAADGADDSMLTLRAAVRVDL
jgi:hypothetical protein